MELGMCAFVEFYAMFCIVGMARSPYSVDGNIVWGFGYLVETF